MKVKNRKGQEEIVGFIVIVVIVTIIAVMLLLFSARKPVGIESSQEIGNFLQSSMYFTTDCKFGTESLELGELVKSCYNSEMCGEESSCVILNRTFDGLLAAGWNLERYSGYELNIYSSQDNSTILDLNAGQQSLNSQASSLSLLMASGNKISVHLKVYAKAG